MKYTFRNQHLNDIHYKEYYFKKQFIRYVGAIILFLIVLFLINIVRADTTFLNDTFEDSSLNSTIWANNSVGTITETSGYLNLYLSNTNSYSWVWEKVNHTIPSTGSLLYIFNYSTVTSYTSGCNRAYGLITGFVANPSGETIEGFSSDDCNQLRNTSGVSNGGSFTTTTGHTNTYLGYLKYNSTTMCVNLPTAGGILCSSYNTATQKFFGISSAWAYSGSNIEMRLYNVIGCNGTLSDYNCSVVVPPDTTAPTFSAYNVTSNNTVSGQNTSTWNSNGTINITSNLLSFTLTTSENANCSGRLNNNTNYTTSVAYNANYKFATTETTSHSYTVFDNITGGNHCLYIHCVDSTGNDGSSGCLNLTRNLYPTLVLNTPPNNFVFNVTNNPINFTYNLTTDDLSNCSIYFNNTLNDTSTGLSNGTYGFSKTLARGNYFWNVSCIDAVGLINTTSAWYFNVTNRLPYWTQNISNTTINRTSGTTTYIEQLGLYGNDKDNDIFYFSIQNENTSQVDCNITDVFNGFCYQETATQSTYCGGLSTGTYSSPNFIPYSVDYEITKMYDGNWSTFGLITTALGVSGQLYVNYTKPTLASSAIVQTKVKNFAANPWGNYFHCYNGTNWQPIAQFRENDVIENYTLPSSCMLSTIQMRYNFTWNALSGTKTWGLQEEGIYWNMTNYYPLNINPYGYWYGNATCTIGINDSFGAYGQNQTFGIEVLAVDTTSPNISLISPSNNTRLTGTLTELRFNVSDVSSINNCSLYINGTLNQTDNSITKDTSQSFYLNTTQGSSYLWKVNCTDYYNNNNVSSERLFTINTKPTTPSLVLPANTGFIDSDSTLLDWNASTDGDSDSLTYYLWFGQSNPPVYNSLTTDTQIYRTTSALGTYYWYIKAYDGYEFSNASTQFSFTRTDPPDVTKILPTMTITDKSYIFFNVSVTDDNLSLTDTKVVLGGTTYYFVTYTNVSTTYYFYRNITGLTELNYSYYFTATNNEGLSTSTNTEYIQVNYTGYVDIPYTASLARTLHWQPATGYNITYASPDGMNASNYTLNITNNDPIRNGTVLLKVSSTKTGYSMCCNDAFDNTTCTGINTTYASVNTSLAPGSTCNVWCWINYTNPSSTWDFNLFVNLKGV